MEHTEKHQLLFILAEHETTKSEVDEANERGWRSVEKVETTKRQRSNTATAEGKVYLCASLLTHTT